MFSRSYSGVNRRVPSYRPRKSKAKLALKAIVILLSFWVGYHFLADRPTEAPAASLAAARKLIAEAAKAPQDKKPIIEAAIVKLDDVEEDRSLAHWAALSQGEARELLGDQIAAGKFYGSISADSPAAPAARLALIRLDGSWRENAEEAELVLSRLEQLEQTLVVARRSDLNSRLLVLKAEAAAASGGGQLAIALLRKLRSKYPSSPQAAAARKMMKDLVEKQESLPSPAEQLQDAELLAREGLFDEALAETQRIRAQLQPQSPAFFEAMAVEERIVRKSGRSSEADYLLATIGAEAGLGIADKAVLDMVRYAWNKNEHAKAIELSESFLKRFPDSSFTAELRYMLARIHEEKGDAAEAKEGYQLLLSNGAGGPQAVAAGLRLAWLHRKHLEYRAAAEAFNSTMRRAQGQIEALQHSRASVSAVTAPGGRAEPHSSRLLIRELYDQYFHAAYWLAVTLGNLDDEELKAIPELPERSSLLKNLISSDPYGAYGLMARQELPEAGADNSQTPPFRLRADESCSDPVAEPLQMLLEKLSLAGLHDLAQYEIDWSFSGSPATADETARLRNSLTRAQLQLRYGTLARGIGAAEQILLTPTPISPAAAQRKVCEGSLIALAFPTPYAEHFKAAAEQTKNAAPLPLALLFAITRTESHFMPEAVSPAGAQGLMQLMPATAKREGLAADEDSFDPPVNIRLGAKHIAGLLKQFKGEKVYALAAYNAGATPVERWLERNPGLSPAEWVEVIGYPETRSYVKKVLRAEMIYRLLLAEEERQEG